MKKSLLFLNIFIFVVGGLISTDNLYSQQFDCKGKDFWFTFIPNFHNYRIRSEPSLKYADSLYMYIASEKPTTGKITYRNIKGQQFVHNFTITDTNKIYTFAMTYYDVELLGYNNSGNDWNQYQCETIAKQSFHLESDEDVSLYALNQAVTTSDAFFIFPTDILGEDYLVMAYSSDGVTYDPLDRTPSQFAIVATEDNTVVEINAKVPTYMHGLNKSWTVNLDQGDVYLVQSAFDYGETNPDLTGSEILANKPIAVFGGQQRSKVPENVNSKSSSRDILVEELQPLKNWGKNAFIVPFFQPYNITPFGNDLFRVLAAKDSTVVFLNGNSFATINKGQFFEGIADRPYIVTSNNPISVAQYKKTSQFFSGDLNVSDPFLLIIPPKEQYQTTYRVINAQSWDLNTVSLKPFKTFTEQYITLIVPDTSISSVLIDNIPTQASRYRSIPGSGYSYLNHSTIDGVHSIYANAPIGVYIYGYGDANSYGYLGGMNFIPLNFRAPRILAKDSCYQILGTMEKYSKTDFGLWDIKVKSANNVNVSWNNFTPPVDTLKYTAQLINLSQDGDFTISSFDSLGNNNDKSYQIPGFTVGLENIRIPEPNVPDTIPVINDTIRARSVYSSFFNVLNYGKYSKRLSSLRLNKPEFTLQTIFPRTVSSKAKLRVNYQVFSNADTTITDTLYISEDCFEKPLVILNYRIIGDRSKPVITHSHNLCDTMIYIVIADTVKNDFGIQKIQITYVYNCIIDYVRTTYNIAEIRAIQDKKNTDAIISIMVTDSSGNVTQYSDTIAGHNLEILSVENNNYLYSFGQRTIGYLYCDSIQFHNKGIPDIIIDNLRLSRNLEFAVPISQFPFVIKGGETKSMFVCFKPNQYDKKIYRDTMRFIYDCIEEGIILEGSSDKLLMDGTSLCNVDMQLVSRKVPLNFFINDIYPNPLSESLHFILANPESDKITFRIYDLSGREVLQTASGSFSAGIFEISINVEKLQQGRYIITAESSKHKISSGFIKSD